MLLSAGSQSEETTHDVTPPLQHSGEGKTMQIGKGSPVSRGQGGGVLNRQTSEELETVKLFCMMSSWWTDRIIPLPKSMECATPRATPYVH